MLAGRPSPTTVDGREPRFRKFAVSRRSKAVGDRRRAAMRRRLPQAVVGHLQPFAVAVEISGKQPSVPARRSSGGGEGAAGAPARRGGRAARVGSGTAGHCRRGPVSGGRRRGARHRVRQLRSVSFRSAIVPQRVNRFARSDPFGISGPSGTPHISAMAARIRAGFPLRRALNPGATSAHCPQRPAVDPHYRTPNTRIRPRD